MLTLEGNPRFGALAVRRPISFSCQPRRRDRESNRKYNGKNMKLKVRPLSDRVLVEPIEEKAENGKQGGIIIPDTAKEKPMESLVVAVGPGKTGDDGKIIFLGVKKGDRVLVSKYGGTELKLEGKEYRLFNGEDILAIIE
jgi:chaperonin GroES